MYLVRVIIADAGRIAARADQIIGRIPPYYGEQYRKIKKKQEAAQELAAGFLLEKYLDVSRDEQLVRLEHGKPLLKSKKHYFNLSHSGEYVVLAVADIDIGVDIERIKDVHWPTVRKVFTEKQREQLEDAGETQQPELFARLWTECESVLKLWGTGFAKEPEGGNTWMGKTQSRSTDPGNTEPGNGPASPMVHFLRYGDYMIACAAYKEFYVSVEEDRSYLHI